MLFSRKKYFEWDVQEKDLILDTPIGFDVFLSENENFYPISYTLSTFNKSTCENKFGRFYYSLDNGSNWIDFPLGEDGAIINSPYIMRFVIDPATVGNIYFSSNDSIYKYSADCKTQKLKIKVASLIGDLSINEKKEEIYIFSGQKVLTKTDRNLISKAPSVNFLREKESLIVSEYNLFICDSKRNSFWFINDLYINLYDLNGKLLFFVNTPFVEHEGSSSSSFLTSTSSSSSSYGTYSSYSENSEAQIEYEKERKALSRFTGNVCFSLNAQNYENLIFVDRKTENATAKLSKSKIYDICHQTYIENKDFFLVSNGNRYLSQFDGETLIENYIDCHPYSIHNIVGESERFYAIDKENGKIIKININFDTPMFDKQWEIQVGEDLGFADIYFRKYNNTIIVILCNKIINIRDDGDAATLLSKEIIDEQFQESQESGNQFCHYKCFCFSHHEDPKYIYIRSQIATEKDLEYSSSSSSNSSSSSSSNSSSSMSSESSQSSISASESSSTSSSSKSSESSQSSVSLSESSISGTEETIFATGWGDGTVTDGLYVKSGEFNDGKPMWSKTGTESPTWDIIYFGTEEEEGWYIFGKFSFYYGAGIYDSPVDVPLWIAQDVGDEPIGTLNYI